MSYHCLHIRSVQPDPAASPGPPSSPELQRDSSDPAGTTETQAESLNTGHGVQIVQRSGQSHLLISFGPV